MWVYVLRQYRKAPEWQHIPKQLSSQDSVLTYMLDLTHKLGGQMQKLQTKNPTYNNKTVAEDYQGT